MAKGSTFPATDVADRRPLILGVLREHDPVPVPVTTLYLGIEDKRALADEFARLVQAGDMESVIVQPRDALYRDVVALTGLGQGANGASVAAYRLTDRGRDAV